MSLNNFIINGQNKKIDVNFLLEFGMEQILIFIIQHCSFLYKEYGLSISNTIYSPANGGAGTVVMENNQIYLRFTYDRGTMNLNIKSKIANNDEYSIWYIMEYITGNEQKWRYDFKKFPQDIPTIDSPEYYLAFQDNFGKIYSLFSSENCKKTMQDLDVLVRAISK